MNRFIFKILIGCLFTSQTCILYAVEKDSLLLKNSMNVPDKVVFNRIYQNASLASFRPDAFSHGDVGFKYNYSDLKNTGFLQDGTSLNEYRIAADGLVVNNNKVFWGNVSYRKSFRKNVLWNNVYDYTRIGPNLLADSVGGTSNGEEYSLLGGLSVKHKRWIFGGKIGYVAGQSYRKTDPRPNAISTDLYLQLSTSYNLMDNYQTGVSFNTGKYRESIKISVEQERGNTGYNFYPFKGFGMYDLLLFESNQSSYTMSYEGSNYGGELFIVPQNRSGILGNVKFDYSTIEPIYGSGNSGTSFRSLYRTYATSIDLGWQKYRDKIRSFIKLSFDYKLGKNTEYLYYSASTGNSSNQQTPVVNYYLLSLDKFYTKKTTDTNLSGGVEWFSSQSIKWIVANFAYNTYEERYLHPQYKMSFERITSSLELGGEFHLKKKYSVIPKLEILYSPLQSNKKILPNTRLFDVAFNPNISIMEADLFGVKGSFGGQYKLPKMRNVYVNLSGSYVNYADIDSRYNFEISVGVKY